MAISSKKKVVASILATSLFLFTSCGGTKELPKMEASQVLKSARENAVADTLKSMEERLSGSSTGKLNLDVAFPEGAVKGSISANGESKMTKDNSTPNQLSTTINGMLEGTVSAIKGKADFSFSLKNIDKILYFNIEKLDASTEDATLKEQLASGLAMVSMFTKKWYMIDLDVLAKQSGNTTPLVMNTYKDVEAMISKVKEHEIFTVVKELPQAEGMYMYQVKPNTDEVVALIKAAIETNPQLKAAWNESNEVEIKQVLTALSGDNVTHTLGIDGTSMKYKKLMSQGKIDNDKATGTVDFNWVRVSDAECTVMLKVNLADKADASKTMAFTVDLKINPMGATSGNLKVDMPSEKVAVQINGESTFQKKDVTVTAPEGAADFIKAISAFGAGAPTPTVEESNMNMNVNTTTTPTGNVNVNAK